MSDATTLHFFGGPLDDPNDGSATLFEAFGFTAASWARLETQVDALLMHINKATHSAELYSDDHPVSFSKKIDLLKRWFNRHPALASHKDTMRDITSRLKVMSRDRNSVVHAVIEAYNADTQTATIQSMKYEGKDSFRFTRVEVTITGFVKLAVAINHTNRLLWTVCEDLFSEDGVRRLETP